MKSDELNKFAEDLKSAREELSVSLQEISSKTRIDIKFLKAIEEADFEVLPKVYIKAFIKEYAALVELDPEETVKKFELARKGKLKDKEKDKSEPVKEKEVDTEEETDTEQSSGKKEFSDDVKDEYASSSEEISSDNSIKYIVGIVVLIVISVVVYFLFIKSDGPEIIKETPLEEMLQEEEPAQTKEERFKVQQDQADDLSSQSPAAVADSLSLRFSASDTCWVDVTIDNGNAETEFMLYPGINKTVKAMNIFELILGNSGGVQLFLNGNPIDHNGISGQRRVFKIDRSGVVQNSN